MMRLCHKCRLTPRVTGERFCKLCRQLALAEMKEAGFLERGGYGHRGMSRTSEQRENVHETKYGTGHG